jgi:hypothetical protein
MDVDLRELRAEAPGDGLPAPAEAEPDMALPQARERRLAVAALRLSKGFAASCSSNRMIFALGLQSSVIVPG